ncbi:MAG: hypothetical protein ABSD99_12140 [Candidatus Bathyarchaeia archaeon]|jgi:hypothetical protein
MAQRTHKEFNNEVKLAIDNALYTILGQQVLKAVYESLRVHHGITSDEIPYRLDTLFKTLESTFGYQGAITLGRVIAKRVYARMGLQFRELPDYELQDYLDQAKKQLTLLP